MRKKIITLGRSSSRSLVDLQMGPDPAISRHHAKIFYDEGTGSYNLRVSGSNGMLVNGKHHASGSDVLLADKAILQAGTFTCVFEVEPHKEWEEAMRAGASVLDSFRVEKIHACSESSQDDTVVDDEDEAGDRQYGASDELPALKMHTKTSE
mmetsp:Transcript_8836/g.17317  ORF Transcript_8836/g.17317 Transcript_8836/m.17317 type:complete len:152 (-) Transcript_8836:354-809(-)